MKSGFKGLKPLKFIAVYPENYSKPVVQRNTQRKASLDELIGMNGFLEPVEYNPKTGLLLLKVSDPAHKRRFKPIAITNCLEKYEHVLKDYFWAVPLSKICISIQLKSEYLRSYTSKENVFRLFFSMIHKVHAPKTKAYIQSQEKFKECTPQQTMSMASATQGTSRQLFSCKSPYTRGKIIVEPRLEESKPPKRVELSSLLRDLISLLALNTQWEMDDILSIPRQYFLANSKHQILTQPSKETLNPEPEHYKRRV